MMMTASRDQLPVFPLPRDDVNPPGAYTRYRACDPVKRVRTPFGTPAWLVTRYRDVREVLRSQVISSNPRLPGFPAFVGFRRLTADSSAPPFPLVDMDPPQHGYYRRIVAPELTVKAISRLIPRVESIVDGLLDGTEAAAAVAEGTVDLIESFCADLPSQIICEMLGFPPAERRYFRALAEEVNDEHTSEQRRAAVHLEMNDYVADKVARRDEQRGEEFIDRLLAARDHGDLPADEVVNLARMMYSAGVGTTANALALSVVALLTHPGQAELMRDPDTDLAGAVEELMRWTSIVHGLARVATEPFAIAGQQIEPGEGLLLALPSANRDPDAFADADRLDLTRPPGDQLGFGQGIHQCPGQQLARVELQIGLSRLLRRFPRLRLAVAAEELTFKKGFVHGVETLPVVWS
jgi:cytochrome P450